MKNILLQILESIWCRFRYIQGLWIVIGGTDCRGKSRLESQKGIFHQVDKVRMACIVTCSIRWGNKFPKVGCTSLPGRDRPNACSYNSSWNFDGRACLDENRISTIIDSTSALITRMTQMESIQFSSKSDFSNSNYPSLWLQVELYRSKSFKLFERLGNRTRRHCSTYLYPNRSNRLSG